MMVAHENEFGELVQVLVQSQLDFSNRFLTQKELDPDAVAFNSNNNRYHFPARFYLPSRAVFGQVDPLLTHNWLQASHPSLPNAGIAANYFQAGTFAYLYVQSIPTRLVDPWGLQRSDRECQSQLEACMSQAAMGGGSLSDCRKKYDDCTRQCHAESDITPKTCRICVYNRIVKTFGEAVGGFLSLFGSLHAEIWIKDCNDSSYFISGQSTGFLSGTIITVPIKARPGDASGLPRPSVCRIFACDVCEKVKKAGLSLNQTLNYNPSGSGTPGEGNSNTVAAMILEQAGTGLQGYVQGVK